MTLGETNPVRRTSEQLARRRDWDSRGKMLAERIRTLAVVVGAKHHEDGVRVMALSRLVDDGCVFGTVSVKTLLAEIRPAIERFLAAGTPAVMSDRQTKVLDIIREHGPIGEKEIVEKLPFAVGATVIRRHDIPLLKEHFGVENDGRGYYIPK